VKELRYLLPKLAKNAGTSRNFVESAWRKGQGLPSGEWHDGKEELIANFCEHCARPRAEMQAVAGKASGSQAKYEKILLKRDAFSDNGIEGGNSSASSWVSDRGSVANRETHKTWPVLAAHRLRLCVELGEPRLGAHPGFLINRHIVPRITTDSSSVPKHHLQRKLDSAAAGG